jgi:hypothetical protein
MFFYFKILRLFILIFSINFYVFKNSIIYQNSLFFGLSNVAIKVINVKWFFMCTCTCRFGKVVKVRDWGQRGPRFKSLWQLRGYGPYMVYGPIYDIWNHVLYTIIYSMYNIIYSTIHSMYSNLHFKLLLKWTLKLLLSLLQSTEHLLNFQDQIKML